MDVTRINDPERDGVYLLVDYGEFEFEDPLQKFRQSYIHRIVLIYETLLHGQLKSDFQAPKWMKDERLVRWVLHQHAFKEWESEEEKYLSATVPQALWQVLATTSKKEQVRALKGLDLTTDEFIAFVCQAGRNLGLKYSFYKSEHNPSGLNEADLPPFAYIEEERDKLKSVGDTSLSDGQLKQIIKHKHVVAAKFLDNDDSWHCFFFTYKALRGEEGSQPPHLHYISSAWNIERSEVIAQLREKNYHLPALPHINYHTHRNPREEEE